MIRKIKSVIKKLTPKFLLNWYHGFLALAADFYYGRPSKKMVVIGVTGTAGKSTVVNLIGKILEEAGFKVGWISTANFKIGPKEWLNKTKMTMLGRFALQKFLKKMVLAGCQYAIIETSSEGIIQSRHLGINYDLAVFTNLHLEHIESHGGFEKYRAAKMKLFKHLTRYREKKIVKIGDQIREYSQKIIVANLDDENAKYFLKWPADEYYGFAIRDTNLRMHTNDTNKVKKVIAENMKLASDGAKFKIQNSEFKIHLLGEFNVYNCLTAIAIALSQGISLEACQKALEKFKGMPGRMETVINQPFKVIVDYAHTPEELEKVYKLLTETYKLICVLGSAGGGRDKWKRPKLGELAEKYCREIVLTNEDPYDENPATILNEIEAGFSQIRNSKSETLNYWKILDRREAIKKALSLAKPNEIVIITGKGCEQWIMGPKGQKIPWDDRLVVREEYRKLQDS